MNKVKNTKEEKLTMFDFIGMSTWEKDWLKTAQAKFYDPYPTVNEVYVFSRHYNNNYTVYGKVAVGCLLKIWRESIILVS